MVPVSVIILNWNGRRLLERFLPSVLATRYANLEVIVADNASWDDSVPWLIQNHPDVRVIVHNENLLYAGGNDAALKEASGELVCFLNNDVEVAEDWLDPLAACFEDPRVGAVQPKVLQLDARDHFEYAGAAGGFLDRAGFPFARGRIIDTFERDTGQYDQATDIFWASGAAFLVRRAAYEKAGGFDRRFGMHMEEIDLCWRLWRSGYRVRVEPRSAVYHEGGGSLPQKDPRKLYFNIRNSLWMLRKHLADRDFRKALRERRITDLAAATRALLLGRTDEARSIRKGWKDARVRLDEFQREAPAAPSILPSYRGLIPNDYYLFGRRRFSELPPTRFQPLGAPASPQQPQPSTE